jgi:hypothetical protein
MGLGKGLVNEIPIGTGIYQEGAGDAVDGDTDGD